MYSGVSSLLLRCNANTLKFYRVKCYHSLFFDVRTVEQENTLNFGIPFYRFVLIIFILTLKIATCHFSSTSQPTSTDCWRWRLLCASSKNHMKLLSTRSHIHELADEHDCLVSQILQTEISHHYIFHLKGLFLEDLHRIIGHGEHTLSYHEL